MLPKTTIIGRLTRDPEMRVTTNGLTITKIAVVSSEKYKNKQTGQDVETTLFADIDCFGAQAEAIAKFFVKSKPIIAHCKIKSDSWETQQGEKRQKVAFTLEGFGFVPSDNTRDQQPQATQRPDPVQSNVAEFPQDDPDIASEEDVQF